MFRQEMSIADRNTSSQNSKHFNSSDTSFNMYSHLRVLSIFITRNRSSILNEWAGASSYTFTNTGETRQIRHHIACKAGGFAGGMIRKQRLRTTGRHFERANKGETGERKKEKGRGWGRGKRREEGGGLGVRRTACPETRAK